MAKAKALAAYPNARQMNVANANYNYGYKGSEINKPSAVFDDGVKTWFVFEGEIRRSILSTPIAMKTSSITTARARIRSSTK